MGACGAALRLCSACCAALWQQPCGSNHPLTCLPALPCLPRPPLPSPLPRPALPCSWFWPSPATGPPPAASPSTSSGRAATSRWAVAWLRAVGAEAAGRAARLLAAPASRAQPHSPVLFAVLPPPPRRTAAVPPLCRSTSSRVRTSRMCTRGLCAPLPPASTPSTAAPTRTTPPSWPG